MSRRVRTRGASTLLALALALAPTRGQGAGEDPATDERARALATDLFDQGVKLMERGRCDAAPVGDAPSCSAAAESFQRAFDLYPDGLGALRNLAYVEKSLGRVASSARHFRELARRAPLDPRPARQLWADFARTELSGLEPRVPHLVVTIEAAPPRTVATLDGTELPRETWGTALELDPGEHALHVEGPGRVSFDQRLSIGEGESRALTVSLLPRAEDAGPLARAPDVPRSRLPPPRTLALITTGVGGALVIVGLGFGAAAISDRGSACDASGCDVAAYEHGRSLARTSNIFTGLGLVTVAGGLVWYFLSPGAAASSKGAGVPLMLPWASADGAGLLLTRRF